MNSRRRDFLKSLPIRAFNNLDETNFLSIGDKECKTQEVRVKNELDIGT